MPIHLYCLLSRDAEPPPAALRGVEGAPVEVLRAGRLAAWVGPAAVVHVTPTVRAAREHDTVNAVALASGETPLPARFGQRFATEADCVSSLEAREAALLAALDRLRGLVEMGVHVELAGASERSIALRDDPTDPTWSPGRKYLAGVQRQLYMERFVQQQAHFLQQRLSALVATHVRQETFSVHTSPLPRLIVSHLVPRDALSPYRQAAGTLEGEPGVRVILITGPFAPYSFASIDG